MKKICVYAICKNESKFVDRWIASMAEADFIVVLDTGSTDNTVELLKNDPRVTRVEQKTISPWSFGEARNESLKLVPAEADICVVSDFDQIWESGWADRIRMHFEYGFTEVYGPVIDYDQDGNPAKQILSKNVHPNDKDWYWFRPIHEGLYCLNPDKVHGITDPYFIIHHKQDLSKPRRKQYLSQTQEWFNTEKDSDDFDPYSAIYYGCELAFSNRPEEAESVFKYGIDNWNPSCDPSVKYILAMNLANICNDTNRYGEALHYITIALDTLPTTRWVHFLHGKILGNLGKHEDAIQAYRKALSVESYNGGWTDQQNLFDPGFIEDAIALEFYALKDKTSACRIGKIAAEQSSDQRIKNNYEWYLKMPDNNVKIGVYCICKNEIKQINKWMELYKDADLVSVLDTGSNDGTYEAVQKFAIDHPNFIVNQQTYDPMHFGNAKAQSLQYIKDKVDWDNEQWIVCCFDIDEFIEADGLNKIKIEWDGHSDTLLLHANVSNSTWWCYADNKAHHLTKELTWKRRIHECLFFDHQEERQTLADVSYLHEQLPKPTRTDYLKLLYLANAEDPDDLLTLSYICVDSEAQGQKNFIHYITAFIDGAKKESNNALLAFAYIDWINFSDHQLSYRESEILDFTMSQECSNILLCNYIGDIYEKTRWDIAEKAYKKALSIPRIDGSVVPTEDQICTKLMLHYYYADKPDYDQAYKYAKQAYELCPSDLYKSNLKFCEDKVNSEHKYVITVYAICKNESQFVNRWLDSMQEADHIVVLDTGSTDNTYELLKNDSRVTRVEQKVFSPWRFDTARNASLELVPEDTDICVCTDLDEILNPGWADAIRTEWKPDTVRGYYKYAWAHNSSGKDSNTFWYDKVHNRNYKWMAPVHEYLLNTKGENEREHCVWFSEKVYLHHYPDMSKSRGSYLPLLELRVQETPNDVNAQFYLAREYGFRGMDDKSIPIYSKLAVTKTVYTSLRAASYLALGNIYKNKKNFEKPVFYYTKAIDLMPEYRDPYLALAEMYNDYKMYHMAIIMADAAQKYSHQLFSWLEGGTTFKGRLEDVLSIAYYYTGKYEESKKNYDIALSYDPDNERLKYNGKFIK